MEGKTKTAISLAIALAIILGWMLWRTDWDSRAIHKTLKSLAELVEKDGSESTFEALGRGRKVPEFFMENAQIEYLPNRSFRAGDTLSAVFLSARSQVETASVRISRHEIMVDAGGRRAESTARVSAQVTVAGGGRHSDSVEYRILWEKVAGDWRIRLISVIGS